MAVCFLFFFIDFYLSTNPENFPMKNTENENYTYILSQRPTKQWNLVNCNQNSVKAELCEHHLFTF